MCLSAGSTLCLDACMLDRQSSISVSMGTKILPYEKSARRGLQYIHITKLLAMGAYE